VRTWPAAQSRTAVALGANNALKGEISARNTAVIRSRGCTIHTYTGRLGARSFCASNTAAIQKGTDASECRVCKLLSSSQLMKRENSMTSIYTRARATNVCTLQQHHVSTRVLHKRIACLYTSPVCVLVGLFHLVVRAKQLTLSMYRFSPIMRVLSLQPCDFGAHERI
jgi:hypothetical protein